MLHDIIEQPRAQADLQDKQAKLQALLLQIGESQLTLTAACDRVSKFELAGMTMTEAAKIFRAKQAYDEASE